MCVRGQTLAAPLRSCYPAPSLALWPVRRRPQDLLRPMSDRALFPDSSVLLRLSPDSLPEQPEPLDHRLPLLPERSRKALAAGLGTSLPGHLYIAAQAELGLERDVELWVDSLLPTPPGIDIVAVPNLAEPLEPLTLELPAGRGVALREAVDRALRQLSRRLGRLLRNDTLRAQARSLGRDLDARSRETIATLEVQARDLGFGVRTSNGSLHTFPVLHGKPLSSEQLAALDETTRRSLDDAEQRLVEVVDDTVARIQSLNEENDEARDQAAQRSAEALVTEEFTPVREAFVDLPLATEFLDAFIAELRTGWRELLDPGHPLRGPGDDAGGPPGRRFALHVLVATDNDDGPPIEALLDPRPSELLGSIAAHTVHGALEADVAAMRAGALLRCSQGAVILRSLDLARQPELWTRLRRTLLMRQIELAAPTGCQLAPRPIPLSTRVVLIGSDDLHADLAHSDPDFLRLFPVKVEVETIVERTDENLTALDAFLVGVGPDLGWLPLDRSARARLVDLSSRLAEDRHQLSLALVPLDEVVSLASDEARRAGRSVLDADAIDAAWDDRRARGAGAAIHALRQVTDGLVLIETAGSRVGVVNGLAVFCAADQCFGQPMRLTAVVAPGTEGVVDVERESHLGGDLHAKGVAILRGLLSLLFGQERPLSLRAQITFEQSYGEIDGDSASSTEFFAILSALSGVPVDQGLAVTGSISQLGEVQAIGGVATKIEGFYDLCASRGLSGRQGVVVPRTNLRHLVLRDDVARAIDEGRFQVHPIDDVRQGIAILTGMPAGERDADGKFPAASVFGRAERRIIELAERLRSSDPTQSDGSGRDSINDELGGSEMRHRGGR